MVGTNQGNTYTGREGVDLAFALNYNPRIGDIEKAFKESKDLAAKDEFEKQKGKANLAKWKTERPDFFYAHEGQKSEQFNDLMDWGSRLMEAGIDDPTTSSRPEAIEFQKAMGEIKAVAKESKAIEKRYNADRQIILNDKKGVYTDASKQELFDWYEKTPLDRIIKEGLLPPKLKYKQPEFAATPFVQEMSGKINDDAPIDNHIEFSKGAVVDNPMLADQLSQMISEMPKDAQNMLQQEADAAGQELLPYYLGKWSYSMKHKKPEDITKLYKEQLSNFKVGTTTTGYKTEKNLGGGDTETLSGETTKAPWNQIKNAAASHYSTFPTDTWKKYQGQTFPTYSIKKGKLSRASDGSLVSAGEKTINSKEDFIEKMAMDKAAQMPYKTKSGKDLSLGRDWSAFGGKAKVEEDFDLWLADLSGKNGKEKQRIAASWMSGRDFEGFEVSNARFDEEKYGEFMGREGNVQPFIDQKAGLTIFRKKKGKKDGVDVVEDAEPLFIDTEDEEQYNRGRMSDIYYAGIKKDKFLYKNVRNKTSLHGVNSDIDDDFSAPSLVKKNKENNSEQKPVKSSGAAWDK